jgi:CDP-glucose 4,6-dehydratase
VFDSIYNGKRVLVTGHTGYKGSWLCQWLIKLGADIAGYSLAPQTNPNHFNVLAMEMKSIINDLRDYQNLFKVFKEFKPEVVFHLGAQASVLVSYDESIETFSSNIMGTANILEACKHMPSVQAVVIVTTDKYYENREDREYGYRENDRLGGHDPYSASKACSELVTASYRQSFFDTNKSNKLKGPLIASARAGNVIGGGDWTDDRLVPDIMRAVANHRPVIIRNPSSIRPWQHVLEPLSGYLLLGQRMLEGNLKIADAWNFGPSSDLNLSTERLVKLMHDQWPKIKGESAQQESAPHEAGFLILDSTKAKRSLGWSPVWGIDATIKHTINWYRAFEKDGIVITDQQIDLYSQDAISKNIIWS